jgi:hypothetical protein
LEWCQSQSEYIIFLVVHTREIARTEFKNVMTTRSFQEYHRKNKNNNAVISKYSASLLKSHILHFNFNKIATLHLLIIECCRKPNYCMKILFSELSFLNLILRQAKVVFQTEMIIVIRPKIQ